MTWGGGASSGRESHARDIALRRRAEQITLADGAVRPSILPRRPLAMAGRGGVGTIVGHFLTSGRGEAIRRPTYVRLLFPTHWFTYQDVYAAAFREQLAMPLRPSTRDE